MPSTQHELLPVIQQENNLFISAALLHKRLKVSTKFSMWFHRRCERYGFEKEVDFFPTLGKTTAKGGRPETDYLLTIDTAKEMAMLEENDTGRAIRRYFIEKEKELRGLISMAPVQGLFKGLRPKRINDKLLYNYREILVRCGYKANSNGNRRHRYWMHFIKDGNTLFITQEFALHLHHQKEVMQNRVKLREAQPVLPLDFGTSSLTTKTKNYA